MFSRLEWMIAGRYLRARRKEGAISVVAVFSLLAIFFGVGALIVVMSVMNGFRIELVKQIIGAEPHVQVLDVSRQGITDYDALAERLRQVDGVTRAAPRLEQTVMATSRRASTGALVRGLRKEDLLSLPGVANPEQASGSLDNYETGIAIGEGVAGRLGVFLGDKVTIITPPNKDTIAGRIPTRRSYEVKYIFRTRYYPYDEQFIFVPLEAAQGLLNKRGRVDAIEVSVERPDMLSKRTVPGRYYTDEMSERLEAVARPDHFLYNWKDKNGAFLSALDAERGAMFVILSLIILIAALNIISGLIMLVKEKGQNIGIMRTFGMTKGAILRTFIICGSAIGVIGTILGVVGGVLFVVFIHDIQTFLETLLGISLWPKEVRGLSTLPAELQMADVINTVIVSLALSFLATLYPAWRAASLDPVEALRYE